MALKQALRSVSLLSICVACSVSPRYPAPSTEPPPPDRSANLDGITEAARPRVSLEGAYQVGMASYYAHKFHGRQTANGEIFDMYGLSAAHRELPLGTVIRVTHVGNGRSLELRVNDRGPFIPGRILDLSLGAAQKLDMVEEGVAEVRIDIVREP